MSTAVTRFIAHADSDSQLVKQALEQRSGMPIAISPLIPPVGIPSPGHCRGFFMARGGNHQGKPLAGRDKSGLIAIEWLLGWGI